MNNIIILYYNDPKRLKDYFQICFKDLKSYILKNKLKLTISEITEPNCTQAYCDIKLSSINNEEYIFIAYCHGTPDSFQTAKGLILIEENTNHQVLKNSYTFTNSCSSGLRLGPATIDAGAKLFFGYTKKTYIEPAEMDVFAECENYAIKLFCKNNFYFEDAQQIKIEIKNKYTEEIDKLYKPNYFAASYLRESRDCLELLLS